MKNKSLVYISIVMAATLTAAILIWLSLLNVLYVKVVRYGSNSTAESITAVSDAFENDVVIEGEGIARKIRRLIIYISSEYALHYDPIEVRAAIIRTISDLSGLIPSRHVSYDLVAKYTEKQIVERTGEKETEYNKKPVVIKTEDIKTGDLLLPAPAYFAAYILYTDLNADTNVLTKGEELLNRLQNSFGGGAQLITKDEPGLYIPILMYHDFVEDAAEVTAMSVEISKFRGDLEILIENGYSTLFFQDIINYVHYGIPLPKKPIIITMDDGYLSNYTLAYPVLGELDAKATIFIIGNSVGRSTPPALPHFDMDQAREMMLSGLVDIQSHSFDLHENTYGGAERDGATRKALESSGEYVKTLKEDDSEMQSMFVTEFGKRAQVFSYPFGQADRFSEELLSNLDYKATVFSDRKQFTYILYDFPRSLYGLNRFSVNNSMTGEEILRFIEEACSK